MIQDPFADVSRETSERLRIYENLVRKWTRRINLVSPKSVDDLRTRHFADSAQLINMLSAPVATWADFGSGGGFPGIVVAILLADAKPPTRLTLIESDQRKSAFLRTVARETGLDIDVIARRIEEIPPLNVQTVSARALAPLTMLLSFADRHLAEGGLALFPKGRSAREEIEAALEHWRFDCETVPSRTDPEAVILKIGEIKRV